MSNSLVLKLDTFFINELKSVSECWIASAMITKDALNDIRQYLNKNTIQKYIVGIGLPTPPEALKELFSINNEKTCSSRIYLKKNLFHPKAYLFKKSNGNYIAYLGSANLTNPGLKLNTELGIKITDQVICEEILKWFERYFNMSYAITLEFIKRYESTYKTRKEKIEQEEIIANNFIESENELDFINQFFKKHHFNAFRRSNWEDRSPKANQERYEVVEMFKELHELIYPHFTSRDLLNLDKHYDDQYLTSSYFHKDGFTSNQLQSIWLHYGKPESVIREYQNKFQTDRRFDENHPQSFINHIRIQVIIHNNDIGIWLVMKDNSCEFDRQNLISNMIENTFRQELFDKLKALNNDYWLNYKSGESIDIINISSPEYLYELIKQCTDRDYFIVGVTYGPLDKDFSENNIANTILKEFQKLYPLYDIIRDKRFG